jgi:hypothetical protein
VNRAITNVIAAVRGEVPPDLLNRDVLAV